MRIAILAPILTAYRIPVYEELARHAQVTLLLGKKEPNRPTWENLLPPDSPIRVRECFSLLWVTSRKKDGVKFESGYFQVTLGYIPALMKLRPDAVLTVELGVRTMFGLLYGTLFRRPVWIWVGETCHSAKDISRFKRGVRSFLARWGKHWISFGDSTTEYLTSLGIPKDRIVQIQNSVDARLFSPEGDTVDHGLPPPVLLFNGQYIARKGGLPFLESVARVQAAGHACSVLMVGGGEDEPTWKAFADTHLKNIRWYPFQKPAEMAKFYRSCDVFVFPTLEDVWGLTPNEAILCGKPVLCSIYAGCCPEIIPDPQARIDPMDPESLDAGLLRAVQGKLAPIPADVLIPPEESGKKIIRAIEDFWRARSGKPPAS